MKLYIYLNLISSISFIIYGFSCLYSKKMKREFIRFEILPYKNFAGSTQIISSLLIILGTIDLVFINYTKLNTIFISIGAFILTIQMLVVIIVRFIKKDSIYVTIPGILYLIINSLILSNYLSEIIFTI